MIKLGTVLLWSFFSVLGVSAGFLTSQYTTDKPELPTPAAAPTAADIEAAKAERTQRLIANPAAMREAPDFRLIDLDGETRSLGDWQDKVIVINFWATWCPPCVKEVPLFVEWQQQYGANGLQFVGIALDQTDPVRDFAADFEVNYPILLGEHEGIELSQQYGNRLGVLPFSAVVNPAGQIVWSHLGELTEQHFKASILPLLQLEPDPETPAEPARLNSASLN